MARILCIQTGLRGMLHSCIELGRRLERAGHEVVHASPHDLDAEMDPRRLTFIQLPERLKEPAPQLAAASSLPNRLIQRAREFISRRQRLAEGVEALGMPAFLDLVRDASVDFVLIDMELEEHIIALHGAGIRFALLNQFFPIWEENGRPPLDSSLIPDGSNDAEIAASWRRVHEEKRLRTRRSWRRYFGTDRASVVEAYAKQSGFPEDTLIRSGWCLPLSFQSLPTLTLAAAELDLAESQLPWQRYVGPMVSSEARPLPPEQAEASLQLLAEVGALKNAGRKVLVATSSTLAPVDNTRLALFAEALRQRPDLVLILGQGGQDSSAEIDRPANLLLAPWLPQLELLAKANLCINHAGIHVIHECIATLTPMLVLSGGRFDQDGNAARVVAAGLGLGNAAMTRDPAAFLRGVDQILGDEEIGVRLRGMKRRCERYAADTALEGWVESLTMSGGR